MQIKCTKVLELYKLLETICNWEHVSIDISSFIVHALKW